MEEEHAFSVWEKPSALAQGGQGKASGQGAETTTTATAIFDGTCSQCGGG